MEGSMKNLFDPAGKVALVTGGTSGLGHAIAEAFLQNGVDVAVCSRHPESAPELAELAAAEGRRYLPVYCDITKEEDVEKMGDIIEKELGTLTGAVGGVVAVGTQEHLSRGQVDNAALVGGDHPALAAHFTDIVGAQDVQRHDLIEGLGVVILGMLQDVHAGTVD